MTIKKQIRDAFKPLKYKVQFGDDYINISKPKGMNCEFYHSGDINNTFYITATYVVKGEDTEIDLVLPNELNEFVAIVIDILEIGMTETKLIEDLKWQLTFISEPEFDFDYFREVMLELESVRKKESSYG